MRYGIVPCKVKKEAFGVFVKEKEMGYRDNTVSTAFSVVALRIRVLIIISYLLLLSS
jgi:hypothetical protein